MFHKEIPGDIVAVFQKEQFQNADRSFRWISSVKGSHKALFHLNDLMTWFYSKEEGRHLYQPMLDNVENTSEQTTGLKENSIEYCLADYICGLKPQNILEVGCSNGRIYRQLRKHGYYNLYTGIEVAEYLIFQNNLRHPEETWICADAYTIPFQTGNFDICFSTYVLEHLVYPERALEEMLRVIRPGGCLILIFPDFVKSGRFSSQQLGFSPGRASEKWRKRNIIDAIVSLYDSRVRLPKALKEVYERIGPFPVNLSPLCLSYPELMGVDIDAVYISSKKEIENWAIARNYKVDFPYGDKDSFSEHCFIAIFPS